MPLTNTLSPDGRFMALFVGPKHAGKTVAAMSCISDEAIKEGKRIYNFDFDGRIRGVMDAPWLPVGEYDYYPPMSFPGQKMFMERANQKCEVIQMEIDRRQCSYEALVADSLTSECFGLLNDAIPLTHNDGKTKGEERKGKYLGTLKMPGPEDYGFEATGTYQFLAFLRSVPIRNVIVTAHVVDKFGKANPDDRYSESIVVGEKLSIRDKIGVNVGIYFDHIFRFDRRMVAGEEKFFVRFRGDIACTSYPGLPVGEFDITGKNFYKFMLGMIAGQK